MSAANRITRVLAPLLLLGLATIFARWLLDSGMWARWLEAGEHGWGPGVLGCALLCLVIRVRLGRMESTLITVLPPALGGALLAWSHGWLVTLPTPASVLGLVVGVSLGAAHALALTLWRLRCWRRREPHGAAWPIASALLVALGCLLLIGGGHAGLAILGAATLLAFACLALPAQLLVPLLWDLVLRSRGANGTAAFRHAYGGLWVLWVMGIRGLWFLLTDRSRGPERRHAAIDLIHRIGRAVADAPLGRMIFLNTERLEPPSVVVANHVSMYDIMAILSLPLPAVILVKSWVWRMPLMGHMTRAAGYINIDGLSTEEIASQAREALDAGISVLVFPEGSRSRDGHIGRFKNGAFAIARALGVKVTPIAVVGSVHVVRAGTWWLGDHRFHLSVLEPMDSAEFEGELADRRMAREARDRIRAELRRLTPETQQGPRWHRPLAGLYRYLGAIVSHYAASKARIDPVVRTAPELCPGQGPVLHAGCGYGLMSARLALCQPWREIRGLDSDPRKVEVASAALGETTGARFEVSDLRDADLGRPETVLLVDVLHYWPPDVQEAILQRLAAALASGGRLVFRDGVRDAPGHDWVHFFERLALLFGFTRVGQGLFFQSELEYRGLFERCGFAVSSAHPELGLSSNLVLVLTKQDPAPEDA